MTIWVTAGMIDWPWISEKCFKGNSGTGDKLGSIMDDAKWLDNKMNKQCKTIENCKGVFGWWTHLNGNMDVSVILDEFLLHIQEIFGNLQTVVKTSAEN